MREDFPILQRTVNGRPLIYLDNAATMQMPLTVMERLRKFYSSENSNIHRGVHSLSEAATGAYEAARETVCRFLGAESPKEIIFTAGTTGAINLAAAMLEETLSTGDELLITEMEHHSNYLVWRRLAERTGAVLRVAPVLPDGTLDMERFYALVNPHTRVAAFTELSNLTGIENPIVEMTAYLREHSEAYILIDGAQGVVHCRKPLREISPDFYCFSGHKLGAPTGTGVLYIRAALIYPLGNAPLRPARYGGGTIADITEQKIIYHDGPAAFEPGTPNYAGVIGLGAALDYWMEQERSAAGEQLLMLELEEGLSAIPNVQILGRSKQRKGCLSIAFPDVHPYDLAKLLDYRGVATRSGHLCALPYLRALGHEYALRFSVAPYNAPDEIRTAAQICGESVAMLRKTVPTS